MNDHESSSSHTEKPDEHPPEKHNEHSPEKHNEHSPDEHTRTGETAGTHPGTGGNESPTGTTTTETKPPDTITRSTGDTNSPNSTGSGDTGKWEKLPKPLKTVTDELGNLSKSSNDYARKDLDTALETKQPDEVWSATKNALFSNIEDEKLSEKIKDIFSDNFGKDLDGWNDLIEGDLIDPGKLIEINRKLADTITSYDKQLAAIDLEKLGKDGMYIAGFREALFAIAGKVSSETKLAVDRGAFNPITAVEAVTNDLDKLSKNSAGLVTRKKFDTALETKQPDDVWSTAKKALFSNIKDKNLVKKIKDIFSDNFGEDLGSLNDRLKEDPINPGKLIKINRKLANTITSYDKQLAAIDPKSLGKDGMYVAGFREALFAIAGKVSSETNWLKENGAFNEVEVAP